MDLFAIKIHKASFPGDLAELQQRTIPCLDPVFESTIEDNQGSMRQGGLCSYNVCNNLSELIDIADLENYVEEQANLLWENLGYVDRGCRIYQSWANRYPPGSYIEAHNHAPIPLTASFYLRKPENSGNPIFENPLALTLKHQPFEELHNLSNYHSLFDEAVGVSEGDLVVFPAYLNHKTEPNQSDQDRLIIGFNLVAK